MTWSIGKSLVNDHCIHWFTVTGLDSSDPALWHQQHLPAYWSALCHPISALILSRHTTKCQQIYLSLWLCVDHLIKHNMQFSGLFVCDNSFCWKDIFFLQEGSFVYRFRLDHNQTEQISAKPWCIRTQAETQWNQFMCLIELLRKKKKKKTCFWTSTLTQLTPIKLHKCLRYWKHL